MPSFTESLVEEAALDWFRALGYTIVAGPDMPPGSESARQTYADVVLRDILSGALVRLNPSLPRDAVDAALQRLTRPNGSTLEARNRTLHRLLVDGAPVEYRTADGSIRRALAQVLDFETPANNDWMAVSQFTITENHHTRRPDIVLFLNGLPLGVIELKHAADEEATAWAAWRQLQVYRVELPSLLAFNEVLAVSDGSVHWLARLPPDATVSSRAYHQWRRTRTGIPDRAAGADRGAYSNRGASSISSAISLSSTTVAARSSSGWPAITSSTRCAQRSGKHCAPQSLGGQAPRPSRRRSPSRQTSRGRGRYEAGRGAGGGAGDRRIGIVWHTPGTGKSLTMAFYAGRIIREPAMANPTIVVLTDRNDPDDQLFSTFARCRDLLRQPPMAAQSRAELRARLAVESGGVIFTSAWKLFPDAGRARPRALSERRNLVVIADEVHRGQYDFVGGATHMRDALPNASFIGFTGAPIERRDAHTRTVFGDYISIYDIQRAIDDHATVPIYYENRLARLALDQREQPALGRDFEAAAARESVEPRQPPRTKSAQLEGIAGAERRVALARDIVAHFEQRIEALSGKAMIVCRSRRMCIDLYREMIRLRPAWRHVDDKGSIEIVITGMGVGSARLACTYPRQGRARDARETVP